MLTACAPKSSVAPTSAFVSSVTPVTAIASTVTPKFTLAFTDTATVTPSTTPTADIALLTVQAYMMQFAASLTTAPTRTPMPPTVTPGPTRTPDPAQVLWRGDLYMHTTCSDGLNSYEEMIQKALELQFDFIAITDHVGGMGLEHCTSATIAQCQAETRLLCIPSTEQTTLFHLLAVGIQKRIDPSQPLLAQVEEIHRQGGLAIAAHPYDKNWHFTEDELIHAGLDAMECARGTRDQNQQQWQLSDRYNIPCVYDSDAHKKDDLGKQYNVCSAPIKTIADLKAALIGKKCTMK